MTSRGDIEYVTTLWNQHCKMERTVGPFFKGRVGGGGEGRGGGDGGREEGMCFIGW